MANMEQYIFNVDADTGKAVAKLKEINSLMNTIEGVRNKGADDYFTTTQKDMDKNMRSMTKLTQLYREMDRDLASIQQKMRDVSGVSAPKNATSEQRKEIQRLKAAATDQAQAAMQQQEQLQEAYSKTLIQFREMASFQQNYSKNFKHKFNSKDLFNLPEDDFTRAKNIMQAMSSEADGVSSKLDTVKAKIQEVNKLERRTESLSRRAEASKYMSHQQAASFRKDYSRATQGYTEERDINLNEMTRIGQERTKLSSNIKKIELNENASQEDIDRKIAFQQTIESMDKEMEARMELNRVLDRTIANMKEYGNRVTKDNGVEVKPERGTTRGMMYERAPAIGLAIMGAVGGSMGALYSKGGSVNESMRDDTIAIGQQTETAGADWRYSIRDNAFEMGLSEKLGMSGQDMLAFQQNYMSNEGFNGMADLNSAAKNQAIFSRTTGVGTDDTQEFFNSVFSSGAVSGDQVKDIQNAFIGAIKASGMEGREKDQLKALQGLLDGVSRGRTLDNQDVMNVMGMQSVLAQSGVRSLSGEQGGQLLSQLNEGIRQGFADPMTRLAFGQGSQYQGLEGRNALREKMDKGISDPDNVNNIGRIAESYSNSEAGQNEVFASFVQERLGTDITAEQAKGMMDLYRNDSLTEENIGKVLQSDQTTGKGIGDEKLSQYQDSKEALANQSEATTEKQAANINDFGDAIRVANAAMGGLPAPVYAAIIAIGAFTAAVAASTASFAGSGMLRGLMGKRMGKGPNGVPTPTGTNLKGGGFFGGLKNKVGGWFGRGGGPSGGAGGAGAAVAGGAGAAAVGAGVEGAAGAAAGGAGAAGGAAAGAGKGVMGKLGSLGKGAGGLLGKALLPVGIIAGVGSVVTADKGEKAEAAGSAAGGILGGMGAGAAAGAALGSVVPGIGNVVGGIGGGIVGGIAGSKVGGWIGGLFGGDDEAEAAEKVKKPKEEKETSVEKQLEKENNNTKDRAENKRGDNIAQERENLKIYEDLLNRADALLSQARMQNGIFGSEASNSANGSVANGGPLVGGDNSEKVYNFLKEQGFSPEAAAGVMGNLQQESGMDPNAVNPTSGAFGIGQWLGGRKKNLEAYAQSKGTKSNDLQTQLEFLMKELEGGDPTTSSILKKNGGLSGLKNASTKNATNWFEQAFERSGGSAMGKRQDYANSFYNQYGTGAQAANSSKARTASSDVKVNSTITVNVKGDEKVSDKVKDNNDLKKVANNIQNKIYGSMGFYAQETRRV